MNVNKELSKRVVLSRYGQETADVYAGLVSEEPEVIPMSTVLSKFDQARRVVQFRKPLPSPTIVPFTSRLVDTTFQ